MVTHFQWRLQRQSYDDFEGWGGLAQQYYSTCLGSSHFSLHGCYLSVPFHVIKTLQYIATLSCRKLLGWNRSGVLCVQRSQGPVDRSHRVNFFRKNTFAPTVRFMTTFMANPLLHKNLLLPTERRVEKLYFWKNLRQHHEDTHPKFDFLHKHWDCSSNNYCKVVRQYSPSNGQLLWLQPVTQQ